MIFRTKRDRHENALTAALDALKADPTMTGEKYRASRAKPDADDELTAQAIDAARFELNPEAEPEALGIGAVDVQRIRESDIPF